jgi:hypothetical protein
MTTRRLLDIAGLTAAALALSALPGCGSGPPTPADPAAARAALDRALTAWKEGKPADSLKNDDPPIVVSDHAWSGGASLLNYRIEPGDRRTGADQAFRVVLWLKDDGAAVKPRGKARAKAKDGQEETEYNVGTSPMLTVVRTF